MKTLTANDVKANISDVLVQVRNGENFKILYGKSKEPVAMLIPIKNASLSRKIGILDGKASFKQKGNGKINEKEFLNI